MQDFQRLSGAVEVKHGVFRNSGSSTADELSFGELPYWKILQKDCISINTCGKIT